MRLEDLVSVDRRRRRWRPRPIALVIVAVGGLALAGALAWGIRHIGRAAPIRPVATPAPPAPDAESVCEAGAPTAPAPGGAYPATWAVRLGQDAEGRAIGIVADPAVHAAVESGFLAAWEWAFQPDGPQDPADLGRVFAPLPEGAGDPAFGPDAGWWYGLEGARAALEQDALRGTLTRVSLEGGAWELEVLRFSTDGRRAVVRGRYRGGTCTVEVLDTASGTCLSSVEGRRMQYTAGMVYDPRDGRWKVAALRQVPAGQ